MKLFYPVGQVLRNAPAHVGDLFCDSFSGRKLAFDFRPVVTLQSKQLIAAAQFAHSAERNLILYFFFLKAEPGLIAGRNRGRLLSVVDLQLQVIDIGDDVKSAEGNILGAALARVYLGLMFSDGLG